MRKATAADIPVLLEVSRKAWLCANYRLAPIEAIRDWIQEDFEGQWYPQRWHEMTVATVDGRPVGVVQPQEDHISGLWVHPDYHRRGIGTRLLRAGEEQLREAGHARVWLPCSCWNAIAAPFYRRRGYQQVRIIEELLPSGIVEKLIIFEKNLQPGEPGSSED